MTEPYNYKPPLGFDIRVKPKRGRSREEAVATHNCEWAGCARPGPHKAPRTPGQLKDYRWFCKAHAQEYNRAWNFFEDMNDEEIAEYQAATITGNRPTWAMGTNSRGKGGGAAAPSGFEPGKYMPRDRTGRGGAADPFDIMGQRRGQRQAEPDRRRHIPRLQRQALEVLHLDEGAGMDDVRQRYKDLVKRFHPDANGGDRGAEDRLRQVINAYRTLRAGNFR